MGVHKDDVYSMGLDGVFPMGGKSQPIATVLNTVAPSSMGCVKVCGVYWRAEAAEKKVYAPGVTVQVRYRRGNTLVISSLP